MYIYFILMILMIFNGLLAVFMVLVFGVKFSFFWYFLIFSSF